jgi:HEAT repeat protein
MRGVLYVVTLSVSLAAPAAAQQPRVVNGQIASQPAGASLQAAFTALAAHQADAAWIGYTVPAAKRRPGSTWCNDGMTVSPVKLEGPAAIFVLYRVENKTVERIRFYPDDCALDVGGLPLHWLDGVKPADSIALLSSFVSGDSRTTSRIANSALAAIAAHADAAAVTTLIRFARQDASPRIRGDALFWVAQKAGERAAGEITAAIANDPDTEVKRRAVFALSQLPKDEGVPLLIQVAKSNKNPAVRKQAMFWLGQSKDPRALEFFEQVLR